MAKSKFIAYYRVSTERQGKSGLGLESQQKIVNDYLNGGKSELVKEFTEIESGKRDDNRPELRKAMAACRVFGATLVISKLDRLARNARFLLELQESGLDFVACDMPSANQFTVKIMAVFAEEERQMISTRTKAALQAAKVRGTKLGTDNLTLEGRIKGVKNSRAARRQNTDKYSQDIMSTIDEIKSEGAISLRSIAKQLNQRGIKTRRDGNWQANSVKRILDRVS